MATFERCCACKAVASKLVTDLINPRCAVDSIKAAGDAALGVSCDVSILSPCEEMTIAALKKFGRIRCSRKQPRMFTFIQSACAQLHSSYLNTQFKT